MWMGRDHPAFRCMKLRQPGLKRHQPASGPMNLGTQRTISGDEGKGGVCEMIGPLTSGTACSNPSWLERQSLSGSRTQII